MTRSRTLPILSVGFFALAAADGLAQVQVVVPNGAQAVEGNASTARPWAEPVNWTRTQHVYDASHFVAQGITSPSLISTLRFRADGGTTGSWLTQQLANVAIDLSTCPLDYSVVSPTLAANVGADVVRVFEGSVTVQAGAVVPGGTQAWFVDIPLTTPFRYDPSAGDLVVEIRRDSGVWPLGAYRSLDAVLAPAAIQPLASRVLALHSSDTVGTVVTNLAVVCQLVCTPITTLHAWFRASTTQGTSPLLVNFTADCYSAAPGAVLSYQWDLDGDGVIDSTAASPSFNYASCGDHTVTLTVSDGVNPPVVVTRTGLIQTDRITASFTATQLGGGVWQCTDTTTPAATAWAWDLDDDGVVDSTAQNPQFVVGTGCSRRLRLTATRACRTSTFVTGLLQSPAQMAANVGGGSAVLNGAPVGQLFDLLVTAPEGVLLCGISSAVYEAFGTKDLSVWLTPDTWQGKDSDITKWRQVAGGTSPMEGGSFAPATLTMTTLEQPLFLARGAYGIAVYHHALHEYSSIVRSTSTISIVGPDMTIAPGVTRGRLFGGNAFGPSSFAGILHYTKVSLNNQGGYGVFQFGCDGSLGVPGNRASSAPRLGNTMTVEVDHLPNSLALFWLGASRTSSSFGPLPIDLSILGAPGCFGRVSLDVSVVLTGVGNAASLPIAIPNNPALLASQFFTQALSLDPPANAFGLVASDAAALVIGS